MEPIDRNTIVTIKKGAKQGCFPFNGNAGSCAPYRTAKKTYRVKVVQHYIENDQNQIHWVGRHGNYYFTDIENVVI